MKKYQTNTLSNLNDEKKKRAILIRDWCLRFATSEAIAGVWRLRTRRGGKPGTFYRQIFIHNFVSIMHICPRWCRVDLAAGQSIFWTNNAAREGVRTPPSHIQNAARTRGGVPMRKANTHKITYSWLSHQSASGWNVFLEKHEARLIRNGPPRYICSAAIGRDCNNIRISATSPKVLFLSLVSVFPRAIIYRERKTHNILFYWFLWMLATFFSTT